jgi:hypothetical protein
VFVFVVCLPHTFLDPILIKDNPHTTIKHGVYEQ